MRKTVVMIVSLIAGQFGSTIAQATELCGTYGSRKCYTPGVGSKIEMTGFLQLTGYTQGTFNLEVTKYNEGAQSNCTDTDKYMVVATTGNFVQLGEHNLFSGTVQVSFFSAGFAVTPVTADAASWLQDNCACGKQWKAGEMILLEFCADPCDTTFLGGDDNPASGNLKINGKPFFANVLLDSTNTKALYMSAFTSDWSQMVSLQPVTTSYPYDIVPSAQCQVTPVDNFCGSWVQGCVPVVIDSEEGAQVESQRYNFTYTGATKRSATDAGTYIRTLEYFSDDSCTKPETTFVETGTMMMPSQSTATVDAYNTVMQPLWIEVTPKTQTAAVSLFQTCPCSTGDGTDQWSVNDTRRITSCPLDTTHSCHPGWWYMNGPQLGVTRYGNIKRVQVTGSETDVIMFSDFNETQEIGYAAPVTAGIDTLPINVPCSSDQFSSSYCDTYVLQCATGPGTYDLEIVVNFTGGKATGDTDGILRRTQLAFKSSEECQDSAAVWAIEGLGWYSILGDASMPGVDGAVNVLMQYESLKVQPRSQDGVDALNGGCLCGGPNWAIDVERKLTVCPDDSCDGSAFFGDAYGQLGSPGYGVMKRYKSGELRITPLAGDGTTGATASFGQFNPPFESKVNCYKEPNFVTYCGDWSQPCQNFSGSLDMVQTWNFTEGKKIPGGVLAEYSSASQAYSYGQGCSNTAELLTIEQIGTYKTTIPAQPAVPGGVNVQISPTKFNVMPHTTAAADLLNRVCSCQGTWAANTEISITSACTPCDVDSIGFYQPFGGDAYGNIVRYGEFVRLTNLSPTTAGYSNKLIITDNFGFMLDGSASCKAKPVPHPSSSSGGLSGGDVFLILFFVFGFVYFAGGMALNKRNTGTAVIPHVDFWRSCPGLVSDGISFTKSKLGGSGGSSSASYSHFGGQESRGDYGSL